MAIIEYSTISFNEADYEKKIEDAIRFLEPTGHRFGIQIHNSITERFAEKLLQYKGTIPFTVHSPAAGDFFLNLASKNLHLIESEIDKAVKYLERFNTDIFFFHGFFTTDNPISHNMAEYRKVMKESIGMNISLENSFSMNPAYFDSQEYSDYKKIFSANFRALQTRYPQYTIAMENDFIGIGSGLQRPKEILELFDKLWFDTGHFWCSSLLHGFDFYKEAYNLIDSLDIVGIHINHNLMTSNDPVTNLKDSHDHLYKHSAQDLRPIIRRLNKKGLDRWTLEIVDTDVEDLKILVNWLE